MNQWGKLVNNLYYQAVSRVRQPIELLFSWIVEKYDKEHQKCVLLKGLFVHVFDRKVRTFILLTCN